MTVSEAAGRDPIEQARALLAAKPDGLIEAVAREAGVSTQAALELLPRSSGCSWRQSASRMSGRSWPPGAPCSS